MNKVIASLVILGVVMGFSASSYASDWDKAGKVLAVIEGARILTGGNVDIIGNITGINRNNSRQAPRRERSYRYAHNRSCSSQPVWVQHFVWVKKYIPQHEEFSREYGTTIVEGHYIQYKVEDGGHWE